MQRPDDRLPPSRALPLPLSRRVHEPPDRAEAAAFGAHLRALRTARGLSGAELARRAGVSAPFVSLLEGGKRRLASATRDRLAAGLGLDPDELTRLLEQ